MGDFQLDQRDPDLQLSSEITLPRYENAAVTRDCLAFLRTSLKYARVRASWTLSRLLVRLVGGQGAMGTAPRSDV